MMRQLYKCVGSPPSELRSRHSKLMHRGELKVGTYLLSSREGNGPRHQVRSYSELGLHTLAGNEFHSSELSLVVLLAFG